MVILVEEEEKSKKKRKKWLIIGGIILTIVIIWFIWALYEENRVHHDKSTIICWNKTKDIENEKEYSITCYGILYKYREYYLKETKKMSAREFTFLFKDFERKTEK